LVPVPLHRHRRRTRGFDQARLLAEEVRDRTGLELLPEVLSRHRPTLPQGDPRVTAREANVLGAFTVPSGRRLVGQRLILIDDVTTSGATARACAGVLRAAGAAEVALLTACRA
jgi:predicted amidophosphoribosyltransferase